MRVGGKKAIPVDVQVIAASNSNLEEKVNAGEFRADLFYRLNTFPINIPPLRERRKDIVPLVYKFAEKFNDKYGTNREFSLSSLTALQQYPWPGNVRELENLVERLVLTARDDIITGDHVNQMLFCRSGALAQLDEEEITLKEAVESLEKRMIKKYMDEHKTHQEIEKILDVSRATLDRKMVKYGLR